MRPMQRDSKRPSCCTDVLPRARLSRTARVSRIAMISAATAPLGVAAFAPSPYSSHRTFSPDTLHTPSLPQHLLQLYTPQRSLRVNTRSSRSPASSTSLPAAASAWLFTPDRTAGVLADTASEAIVSTASAAVDAGLEVAAHAVDIAATVTTDTVVQTIYKAPFLSLAISFLLGGLFFSTVAAVIASAIALGKENTRRLREVMGIVYRRNWSVIKENTQFTLVSAATCVCCAARDECAMQVSGS